MFHYFIKLQESEYLDTPTPRADKSTIVVSDSVHNIATHGEDLHEPSECFNQHEASHCLHNELLNCYKDEVNYLRERVKLLETENSQV